jgi:thymidylate synthase ThyX
MLTIEWQPLSPRNGYDVPPPVEEAGYTVAWHEAMSRSAALYDALVPRFAEQAAYAVSLAYNIRYSMQMNAREAMHLCELRSSPAGHASYRRVAQQMHRLIAERAGHRAIADAMTFVDHGAYELERLAAERAAEERRALRG